MDVLKQKLDSTLLGYVKRVEGEEKPHVDKLGRETNYYIMIDDKRIWLYQPGTVMFESAVKEGGDLAVNHGGSQQNGLILGNGCASFLCKFVATLTIKYNKVKQEKERVAMFDGIPRDLQALNQVAYTTALTDTLKSLVLEDVTSHGRIIEIKDLLQSLTVSGELSAEQLSLIYAKDILTLRAKEPTEQNLEELRQNTPTEAEMCEIIKKRTA